VNVDGTDTTVAVEAPRFMHQAGAGQCPAGMLHKEIQQFELGQRQAQVFAVQRPGETGREQEEITELQRAVHCVAPAANRQAQPYQ